MPTGRTGPSHKDCEVQPSSFGAASVPPSMTQEAALEGLRVPLAYRGLWFSDSAHVWQGHLMSLAVDPMLGSLRSESSRGHDPGGTQSRLEGTHFCGQNDLCAAGENSGDPEPQG